MRHRALLSALAVLALMTGAAAETKLTDFNGEWQGKGRDRESLFQSLQDTTCRNAIRADLKRMRSDMTCTRPGISKRVQMTITLEGDRFAGEISQKTSQPGKEDAVINGRISGQKTNDTANFEVTWQGATPRTTVALKLNSPSSYSMTVSALGVTVMDVTLTRAGGRPR